MNQTRESIVSLDCHLGVHDESFSKEDALLNIPLFPPGAVVAGDRIRIVALETNITESSNGSRYEYDKRGTAYEHRASGINRPSLILNGSMADYSVVGSRKKPAEISYVFTVKDMQPELSSKHPNLEVHMSSLTTIILLERTDRYLTSPCRCLFLNRSQGLWV